MFLNAKQRILVVFLEGGPSQNSEIAKRVGIIEQWCSEIIKNLEAKGLVQSQIKPPKRINRLTDRGVIVARRLMEIATI